MSHMTGGSIPNRSSWRTNARLQTNGYYSITKCGVEFGHFLSVLVFLRTPLPVIVIFFKFWGKRNFTQKKHVFVHLQYKFTTKRVPGKVVTCTMNLYLVTVLSVLCSNVVTFFGGISEGERLRFCNIFLRSSPYKTIP